MFYDALLLLLFLIHSYFPPLQVEISIGFFVSDVWIFFFVVRNDFYE